MTPNEIYEKQTGKSIWKIKDHTYTDEYSEWVKNYAKTSDSKEAKVIRGFAKKINKRRQNE